eukprot:maker-scaffold199_size265817-snap-gene-1.55 protein:Tk08953 transcript:maker-scaffold199_size265817-snap-gene-1.55-mRNA-1 annotation:"zinc finger matrin-type protein 3"
MSAGMSAGMSAPRPAVNPAQRPLLHRALSQPGWAGLRPWIQSYPEPLPEALLALCQERHCDLCAVRISGAAPAAHHYGGRIHAKHARHFLARLAAAEPCPAAAERLGRLLTHGPQVARPRPRAPWLDPAERYCPVCQCGFTSASQAALHRSGRNHGRKLAGLAALPRGYFHPKTGQWRRQPPVVENPTVVRDNLIPLSEAQNDRQPVPWSGPLFCSVCQVSATSQMQLELHFNGKNHKKAVHRQELLSGQPKQSATSVSSEAKPKPISVDYRAFKTPSGQYYCAPCNSSMNSVSQIAQHFISHRHKQVISHAHRVPARKSRVKPSVVTIVRRPRLIHKKGQCGRASES